MECDVSSTDVGGVLSQEGQPVCFHNEKLSGSKLNYSTYDVEFYAVINALQQWWHCLIQKEFILYTDYEVLKYINSQKKLSRRHIKLVNYLQEFHFVVKDKSDAQNRVADVLSKMAKLLGILRVEIVGFDALKDLYARDPIFANIFQTVQTNKRIDYQVQDSFLFLGVQLCIPNCSLREKIVQKLYAEDHFDKDKTLMLIHRQYYWPKMKHDVFRHVQRCQLCQVWKGTATNAGLYTAYS